MPQAFRSQKKCRYQVGQAPLLSITQQKVCVPFRSGCTSSRTEGVVGWWGGSRQRKVGTGHTTSHSEGLYRGQVEGVVRAERVHAKRHKCGVGGVVQGKGSQNARAATHKCAGKS